LTSTPLPPPPTLFPYTTLFRSRPASQRHLENVEPAGVAVHRVDDAPLVDINIVQLDRAGRRARRRAGNEVGDLPRLEWIANVVRSEEHTSELQSTRSSRMPSSA